MGRTVWGVPGFCKGSTVRKGWLALIFVALICDPNIARPDIGVMGLVTNGAKAIVFLTTRSLDGSEPKRMI